LLQAAQEDYMVLMFLVKELRQIQETAVAEDLEDLMHLKTVTLAVAADLALL
jgi:hypothetical protein